MRGVPSVLHSWYIPAADIRIDFSLSFDTHRDHPSIRVVYSQKVVYSPTLYESGLPAEILRYWDHVDRLIHARLQNDNPSRMLHHSIINAPLDAD